MQKIIKKLFVLMCGCMMATAMKLNNIVGTKIYK